MMADAWLGDHVWAHGVRVRSAGGRRRVGAAVSHRGKGRPGSPGECGCLLSGLQPRILAVALEQNLEAAGLLYGPDSPTRCSDKVGLFAPQSLQ
uniref:Uncharacterized protein n=1 Tax=Sphaerodactylus townsendi TaxID=933632 RepID=A0ACB8G041_9SAUR